MTSQSANFDAILYFPWVRFVKKSLAIPHFYVKNIGKIDPKKLKECGFKGLIFDKDNTLTAPGVNKLHSAIRNSFEDYKSVFGDNIIIMSNSAGTKDDKNYENAELLGRDLGITVLLHNQKKPSGINAALDYFSCNPRELVMFGDRIFTDIVFGNRYGMLTAYTTPLTGKGDNIKIRGYELALIEKLIRSGKTAPNHPMYKPDICLENLLALASITS